MVKLREIFLGGFMRYIYFILIVLAGIAFGIGCYEKVYTVKSGLPSDWTFPPLALWRFSIAALAFAIVFVLLDIRDHLLAKKKEE